ncbi:hypothetical protein CHARACLAT_032971 [Characodon lateralis]|uniref:Uncharacterized protein n=1 Tax=Characodon lateralis TaxID=208331 RepID=A0ABU7F8B0_9TELE|nr:hypothetical protein [Characodon lateralis]
MEPLGPGKTCPMPRRSGRRAGGVCGGGALHWGPRIKRGLHGDHTEARTVVSGSVSGRCGVYFHLCGGSVGVLSGSPRMLQLVLCVCVGGDLTGTFFLPPSRCVYAGVYSPSQLHTPSFLSKCRRNPPVNTKISTSPSEAGCLDLRSQRWAEKQNES